MPAEDKLRIRKCVWPVSEPLLIRFVIKNVQMNTKSTTQFHCFLKEKCCKPMPKIRPAKRLWRKNQQSTCRDQWCESGMRQKDPNTPAIHEIRKIHENHAFLIAYLNETASGWRRKNLDPGEDPAYKASWTGLQSVLNRPTKRLEPACDQRSSRKSQSVESRINQSTCRPGEKSGVLAAIYKFSTFAPWKWAHFQNTYKNSTCQFLNRHGEKSAFKGFIKTDFKF